MRGPLDPDGKQGGFYSPSTDVHERVAEKKAEKKKAAESEKEIKNAGAGDENQGLNRYRPTPKKTSGRFGKKKIAALAGGAGITGGIIALMFTFLSGPLQFLHAGQMVAGFFNDIDDLNASRITKMVRTIKNTNNPENRRLGALGNRATDRIRAKFEADGIKLKVENGILTGVEYNGEVIDFSRADSNLTRRSRLKAALSDAGYGRVSTALLTRPVYQRYGVDLRPFGNVKRLANQSLEEFKNNVRNNRNDQIKGGIDISNCSGCGEIKDQINDLEEELRSGPNETRLSEINSELDKLRSDLDTALTNAADNLPEEVKAYRETQGTQIEKSRAAGTIIGNKIRVAARGSAVVGVAMAFCTLQEFGNQIIDGEIEGKIIPTINHAGMAKAMADQIKSGDDISLDELSVDAERFSDSEGVSWTASSYAQYALNDTFVGEPPSPGVVFGNASDDPLAKITNYLPDFGVSEFCSVASNAVVQALSTVAEITFVVVTTPFTAGGTVAAKLAASAAVESIASFFVESKAASYVAAAVGDPIPAMINGPDYGAVLAMGGHMNSNLTAMELGGRVLSPAESLALKYDLDNQSNEFASIAHKYFDLENIDSLAGTASVYAYSNPPKQLISNPSSVIAGLLNIALKPINGNAYAESPQEVFNGIPDIGFSLGEQNSDIFEDDPLENERIVYQHFGNDEAKVLEAIDNCTIKMPTSSSEISGGDNPILRPGETLDKCDLDVNSNMYLRLRLYSLDYQNYLSLGCYSGDDQSCSDLGLGSISQSTQTSSADSIIIGDPNSSSENIPCAEGTKDLGIYDAYVSGQLVKSRMCAIIGFRDNGSTTRNIPEAESSVIVNSRVSGAVRAFYLAAKADGITLVASSTFRTNEKQKELYDCWKAGVPGCNPAAKPGTSSHQNGTAIDFQGVSGKVPGVTCENRVKDEGNPVWQWLEANLRDYGFKQFSQEAWHWDTQNGSYRC